MQYFNRFLHRYNTRRNLRPGFWGEHMQHGAGLLLSVLIVLVLGLLEVELMR